MNKIVAIIIVTFAIFTILLGSAAKKEIAKEMISHNDKYEMINKALNENK